MILAIYIISIISSIFVYSFVGMCIGLKFKTYFDESYSKMSGNDAGMLFGIFWPVLPIIFSISKFVVIGFKFMWKLAVKISSAKWSFKSSSTKEDIEEEENKDISPARVVRR